MKLNAGLENCEPNSRAGTGKWQYRVKEVISRTLFARSCVVFQFCYFAPRSRRHPHSETLKTYNQSSTNNKESEKALRETQTLCAGCSKAEPKNFAPPRTPFQGAQDGQNLISWRWSLPYLQTQFGEDRCMKFRVVVVTDPQTHKQTHRQDRLQYTAPQLASAQCKQSYKVSYTHNM